MPRSALTGNQKKIQKQSHHYIQEMFRGQHGPTTSLEKLMHDFQRAGKGAGEIYAPIKEQAIADFQQGTAGNIFGTFGRESGSSGSALNQALAAARANLERQLSSDFASFQTNLAGSLLSQREANKQNRMNTLSGIAMPWSQVSPYLPSEKGPNRGKAALGGAISGAIQGGMAGGPWGALAGGVAGGAGGYFGAGQGTDYTNIGEKGGSYLQQKFGSLPLATTQIGSMNQM